MKRAELYQRDDALYVVAQAMTTAGLWIHADPRVRLAAAVSDVELGKALRDALARSMEGVPHPDRDSFGLVSAPLLALAAVKTWSTFEKRAVLVSVIQRDAAIRLVPQRKVDRGFVSDEAAGRELGAGEPDEALGAHAKRALEDARGSQVKATGAGS